jgi:hypothetical protein
MKRPLLSSLWMATAAPRQVSEEDNRFCAELHEGRLVAAGSECLRHINGESRSWMVAPALRRPILRLFPMDR